MPTLPRPSHLNTRTEEADGKRTTVQEELGHGRREEGEETIWGGRGWVRNCCATIKCRTYHRPWHDQPVYLRPDKNTEAWTFSCVEHMKQCNGLYTPRNLFSILTTHINQSVGKLINGHSEQLLIKLIHYWKIMYRFLQLVPC